MSEELSLPVVGCTHLQARCTRVGMYTGRRLPQRPEQRHMTSKRTVRDDVTIKCPTLKGVFQQGNVSKVKVDPEF